LTRAAAGDSAAWGALLTTHQQRLARMVAFRMDPRLRGRLEADDVVQEAFVAASEHRGDYFRAPSAPLFLWLRGVVAHKLLELHRFHLGTRMRDAKRDRAFDAAPPTWAGETSEALCAQLTAGLTRPSVDTFGGEHLLAELTDDFLRRHRAGERPSVEEYTSRHPNLAGRILELFPIMLAMEQRGVGATLDAAPLTERVGATIGRYKLM